MQSAGRLDRRGRRELKRASVARNCWMRFSGGGEGGRGWLVVVGAVVVEVGAGEEKGVKCSDIGTIGKRDVQNVYFSNGVEVGKGESMMRDVEWRVHYMSSLPTPPLPRRRRRRGLESIISTHPKRQFTYIKNKGYRERGEGKLTFAISNSTALTASWIHLQTPGCRL